MTIMLTERAKINDENVTFIVKQLSKTQLFSDLLIYLILNPSLSLI